MYPFARMSLQMSRGRRAGRIGLLEEHVSHHICWPWDIDFWMELNNGRTLTLYDLGRLPLAERVGMIDLLKERRWGMTVAGSTIRYRRRVRAFDRYTMRSRGIGWDHRFFYIEQAMWRQDGECANHGLIRMAVTGPKGILDPAEMAEALGAGRTSPALPDWVTAWVEADATRPWPPMQD